MKQYHLGDDSPLKVCKPSNKSPSSWHGKSSIELLVRGVEDTSQRTKTTVISCKWKFLSCLVLQPFCHKELHRNYLNYNTFWLMAQHIFI